MEYPFTYHAFISHVFEDKKEIADPLNQALRVAGFNIWYSGSDLKAGDDLNRKILGVIPKCKYAIVIISPDYLKSDWAQKELKTIEELEQSGTRIILPIWHHLSQKEVKAALPFLADRFALFSAQGMDAIIPKLVSVLKKRRPSGATNLVQSKSHLSPKVFPKSETNINTNTNNIKINIGNTSKGQRR